MLDRSSIRCYLDLQMKALISLFLAAAIGVPVAQSALIFDGNFPGDMIASSSDPAWMHLDGSGWEVGASEEGAISRLSSAPLVVSSTGSVSIELRHVLDFELFSEGDPQVEADSFDGGQLNVSVNGGAETLWNDWVTGGYTPDIDGVDGLFFEEGWSGFSDALVVSTATIDNLSAGDTVQFIFEAGWDGSVINPEPNWILESFSVTNVVPEPASATLLALGLAAGAGRRKRMRH